MMPVAQAEPLARARRVPRVLVAKVQHETNTFCRREAGIADFRIREFTRGPMPLPTAVDGDSELDGFAHAIDARGWEATLSLATEATPCGPVEASAWRLFRDCLCADLAERGPFDVVLLALHGAMVSRASADADGALVTEIRRRVGPGPLIACTLDLHANVSDTLAAAADVLVPYETYPHVDLRATAEHAVAIVERALESGTRPRTYVFRNAQLVGCDHGRTTGSVMPALLRAATAAVGGELWHVGICAGFPWADIGSRSTGPIRIDSIRSVSRKRSAPRDRGSRTCRSRPGTATASAAGRRWSN